MIDLCKIKEDFSVLVKEAQPWTLTQFVMWLDLKLSEFKIKGYMVLDHQSKTKPQWIAVEDPSGDLAPTPAPCRQCNKNSTEASFYSDIHTSPTVRQPDPGQTQPSRARSREPQQSMVVDDDNVRGEVGIIDLSHEMNRKAVSHENPRQSSLKGSSNVPFEKDKARKADVIDLDSPSEKMFKTSYGSKTSSPIQPHTLPKPKHRPLMTGTTIYTSTQTSTTSTFSTGHMTSASRPTPPSPIRNIHSTNRSFALGAPPVLVSTPSSAPSNMSDLDDMIEQAVKYTDIRTEQLPSQNVPRVETQHSHTMSSGRQDAEKSTSQNTFSDPSYAQTSNTAVPVALHANIDNINRDNNSSSDTVEIKIEAEVDNSNLSDMFITGFTESRDTSSFSHLSTSNDSFHTSPQRRGGGQPPQEGLLPKQGLVDPEVAMAHQMVELVVGSGVYVFDRTISQAFRIGTESQTGTYNGEKMARYLLNVFWSRKELVGATLSKAGRGKKILNQQIIEAILGNDSSSMQYSHDESGTSNGQGDSMLSRQNQMFFSEPEIDIPTFEDPIVRRALLDEKPLSRHLWSKIITRCAYHLLSKGVPKKHDYQAFAEKFYHMYPCVGSNRGPNPWTLMAKRMSQRIRWCRWNNRKK